MWSPTFSQGLNIAADWWNVRIENTIVGDAPSTILNDCYVQGITSRCSAALFTRDPVLGIPVVTFGSTNAGFREVEGYDFDVAYRFSTDNLGDFSVTSNTTYVTKDVSVSTNDPRYPLSAVSFGSTFRVRSNLNLGWQYGDFGISWMMRYYSAMKEGCTYRIPGVNEPNLECNEVTYAPTGQYLANGDPASALEFRRRTGSNTFNDVQVRYQTPWNATVALGANNVFNHYGPVMYSQPSANVSYYGGFDIGRFIYMKYTQRF